MFRRVVGVELSGSSLHAVAVRWGWKHPILDGVLCLDLPDEEGNEDAWRGAREALRGWQAARGRPAMTVASLPGTEGFPANLRFPFRRISQIRKVIKPEMEGEIPLPIEETVVDFFPAPRPDAEGLDVFAVAVPKAALVRHLSLLERLGISPGRMHYSPLAELGAALKLMPEHAERVLGIVHVDPGYVSFLVAKDGMPVRLRAFRRRFPSKPGSGGKEGDERKERGSEVDSIVRELQITLRSWQASLENGFEIGHLALTGKAASAGLTHIIEDALEIPCRPLTWGAWASLVSDQPLPPQTMARVSAALGASLGALNPIQKSFDLRREEFAPREGWGELKRPLFAATAAVLATGGIALGDLTLKVRRAERRLFAVENQVRSLFDEVFPEGKRIVDPQSQLAARVQEQSNRIALLVGSVSNGGGPLDVIAKIHRAIPASLRVRLNRLEVDDLGVLLEGETVSFEGVERIKSGLGGEAGFERLEVRQARLLEGRQGVHFLMRVRFSARPMERGR